MDVKIGTSVVYIIELTPEELDVFLTTINPMTSNTSEGLALLEQIYTKLKSKRDKRITNITLDTSDGK